MASTTHRAATARAGNVQRIRCSKQHQSSHFRHSSTPSCNRTKGSSVPSSALPVGFGVVSASLAPDHTTARTGWHGAARVSHVSQILYTIYIWLYCMHGAYQISNFHRMLRCNIHNCIDSC